MAANAGFIGLCVNGQVTRVPASDPLWDPFYQLAIEADRPIMILTGLTGIGQGLPGGDGYVLDHGHPRHIDLVAARFPKLKVLAARPAYPWQDEMLAILAHKPNVILRVARLGAAAVLAASEEGDRGPLAGPRDVRLRLPGAAIREG